MGTRGRTSEKRRIENSNAKQKRAKARNDREARRKRLVRQSQSQCKKDAEAQRMREFRQAHSTDEKFVAAKRLKDSLETKRGKRFFEIAQEVAKAGNTFVLPPAPEQFVDIAAVESLFWASSGLDKSNVAVGDACRRSEDLQGYISETFGSRIFACAACGEICVASGEEMTTFRKDVVEAFSVQPPLQCNSERGVKTRVDDKYYTLRLIKALVGPKNNMKDGHFMLCDSCVKSMNSKCKVPDPLWTVDLGDVGQLPGLTPVEKAAIAASRVYGMLIKIKYTVAAEHQPTLMRGHFICFPHNAAERVAETVFPKTNVASSIQIHFVGSKTGWEKMQPLLESHGGVLEVRSDVLRMWLEFLKVTNKYYYHIKTDYSNGRLEELKQSVKRIVADACVTDNAKVDNKIGTTVGKTENVEEDAGMPAVVIQAEENIRTVKRATKDVCKVVLAKETGDALNEFERNEELFATSFPWVFATGNVPGEGKLREVERRCLLLRYDHRVEREPLLVFLMFNQMQRHSYSHNVAHADRETAERLNEICGSSTFDQEVKNMISGNKEGDALTGFFMQAIRIGQGATAFSQGECDMFYVKLIAEVRFRGSPSVWLTMSPRAMENSFCLRLCFGDGYTSKEEYACRSSRVFDSPAMTSLFFEIVTKFIEEKLLRVPSRDRRKTKPAFCDDQEPGVFGKCSAYCRAVESQGRTLLHFHALMWTELSPEMIQEAIKLNDEALSKIVEYFDACVTSSMPADFWAFSNEA